MSETIDLSHKVIAYESAIRLPTYAIKGENPNPVFRSQYGVAHIYPYTLLDDIDSSPAEKSYRTLILENRYLRVTVLPDLGGRVYSLYDKLSQREVFYRNNIIKFSPLAIRGAFFSGGLEFSFPVAHAPTTADSINWDLRQNEDGSASIFIGGIEHISRLRWMITLTLFPDRCALAQDVLLYNPYLIPGRYHYWTNASLDADHQTEFVYPLRRVRSYEFAGSSSWPVARLDLILKEPGLPGMEGVPMWPADRMQEAVNFRWQKNMLAQVSIFGRDVAWDFFGAWQHSRDYGYAHFANHRDVAGMKLWSWGNAGVGVVNQTALTDDGSVYAETQCGAMETQLDFAFLSPGNTRSWREWWLPLRGTGGLTCASEEAAVRIHLSSGQEPGWVNLTVGVCPVRDLGQAKVQLSLPDKPILIESVHIAPDRPWLTSKPVRAADLADLPISITVTGQDGRTVLEYTLDRRSNPAEPSKPETAASTDESQAYYLLGLQHENFDNRENALLAYQQAIELSARNGEAHFRLGLMLLRAADFSDARHHLVQAAGLGLGDSHYYLGVLELLEGRLDAARRSYLLVPADSTLSSAARSGLGLVAMHERNWQQAVSIFQDPERMSDRPPSEALLLGIALRKAGRLDEARRQYDGLLKIDPLNHVVLQEMSMLEPAGPYREKLERMLADDRQYILDLACFYADTGLLEDAISILISSAKTWQHPLAYYLIAHFLHTLGRVSEALDWLAREGQLGPQYVFPSRLEEVRALRFALDQNPQDHKAHYYLGNFLYARQRYDEAVREWQASLPGLDTFDVVYRNLGLAAWQRQGDLPQAIEFFENALRLNPYNQDLYLHLDDLYASSNEIERREQLLLKIDALTAPREDVRKRSIRIRVELGRYEEALQIMKTQKFVPLEMDQSFHNLYVKALLLRAAKHQDGGQIEQAIEAYHEALEFPPNLGVGRPLTTAQAQVYYLLGMAYEKLGRFQEALSAWRSAASEHHPVGTALFQYVQMSLDKLSRYSELGFEG